MNDAHPSTPERLIEAALELVAERDFQGTTTRLIAKRAGVAEVTHFRLFALKQQLIAAATEKLAANLRAIPARPSGDQYEP